MAIQKNSIYSTVRCHYCGDILYLNSLDLLVSKHAWDRAARVHSIAILAEQAKAPRQLLRSEGVQLNSVRLTNPFLRVQVSQCTRIGWLVSALKRFIAMRGLPNRIRTSHSHQKHQGALNVMIQHLQRSLWNTFQGTPFWDWTIAVSVTAGKHFSPFSLD